MKPQFLTRPLSTWVLMMILLLSLTIEAEVSESGEPIFARQGCPTKCGEVDIPFPFGIGAGCFLHSWFQIDCRRASPHSKPFLFKLGVEVLIIQPPGMLSESLTVRIPPLNICTAETQRQELSSSIDLRGGPYTFSTRDNVFVMQGCAGSAMLVDQNSGNILAGCATACHQYNDSLTAKNCLGVECCQTDLYSRSFYDITSQLQFYHLLFSRQSSGEPQNCLVAALMSQVFVKKYVGKLSTSYLSSAPPVVLAWSWNNSNRPDPNPHSNCQRIEETNYVSCSCEENYYGNPYVSNGCQNPDQCKSCPGRCKRGQDNYYCNQDQPMAIAAIIGLSAGIGILLLLISCYGISRLIKRIRGMKQKAEFFKRNGGFLLQQQLSSSKEGAAKRTKIFTSNELEKATNRFNMNLVIGQGGQGTVYKGMLSDGTTVAVKMSKLLDESQLEQFINEVVILSQINHRNVVKLLGCCLETEVPLLVYEFVPNGTLAHHIHDVDEHLVFSWEMRLKIAAESAGAIAYLHSSSSIPIYHRDIKSTNILLDEKYKAKVSDFGLSKIVAIDQTHLTTIVQGTMGYLDPEYFQTYQFTEKSDVFSYGVVLLELLTGKKPIYRSETMEPKNLVTEFLIQIQNSGLSNILDPQVVKEAKGEEVMIVVDLAKRCTSCCRTLRPTMKEVAMTLEKIIRPPEEMSPSGERVFYESENAMAVIYSTYAELMSNPPPRPASAGNLHYYDVQPLLPHTL